LSLENQTVNIAALSYYLTQSKIHTNPLRSASVIFTTVSFSFTASEESVTFSPMGTLRRKN